MLLKGFVSFLTVHERTTMNGDGDLQRESNVQWRWASLETMVQRMQEHLSTIAQPVRTIREVHMNERERHGLVYTLDTSLNRVEMLMEDARCAAAEAIALVNGLLKLVLGTLIGQDAVDVPDGRVDP